ncbi:type 1 glutamine amidotransferase [Microvirga sp. 17 mud 1-3]|uniref:type 1 glutamine amidotransferase n=1 Tax=Microvirga sp. 17 mud 1-3 TaxID=2082949 RepID=UPI000D6D016A|nr:type 1 glutamine amidotransferase [Microvirga sp. 17 mud 1-3]AWM88279.1 glutamine amidotransferase [Microvirga sp. 17 mud 1-3]
MGLRFLVVEGNTRDARQTHRETYGLMPSESYAAVLQGIAPDSVCDLAFPADEGANLPDAAGLESYDGVVLTGSHLNIYDRTPDILRQIDLMRAIYASGTPSFGSCWGLQVAAVAAEGDVRPNPSGREVGFARRLVPTQAGQGHPMLAGRPAAYDAPAIHLDMVTAPPAGCTILASNAVSFVQAAEITAGGGTFWGVQYHPEFSLGELAVILGRRTGILVGEGFCRTAEEAAAYVADLKALEAQPDRLDLAWRHGLDQEVLDPERRTREIRNFITHRVRPEKSARGRA